MNFTYPAFLFALAAIAIPIIIHLFNFRRFKTVYFSNIRFLKEVKQETQAKSKLKHLLVLAARILAVTFLVLAFAQPYLPVNNRKIIAGDKLVSIYVDNSFSMEAINKNGTLLDEAKKRAAEIVAAYKPTDRFQLLTNDFEGKHQRLVNKEEFTQLLDEIKISPTVRTISEVASRQADLLQQNEAKAKTVFMISDFQKTITNIEQLKNDTSLTLNFVPLTAAEKNNVYVDTCWFETPVRQLGQVENLHVRIKNVSEKVLENNSIKLFINGQQKTPATFNVDKESETEIVLSYVSKEAGVQQGRVEVNDYPVTFDDKFYFSYEVAKNIPVLSINASNTLEISGNLYINKLFATDSLFVLNNSPENKLDYSTLGGYRLIVLNGLKTISSGMVQELKRFISNGGSVVVFPAKEIEIPAYNDLFATLNANQYERLDTAKTKVDRINLEHTMYKDVFDPKTFSATNLNLPIVNKHYVLSKATRNNEEYLMKLQNGDIFFSVYNVGKGKLYISAVPPDADFSNFPKHSVFVPTLYKAAIYSQAAMPLFYTIGKDETIETTVSIAGENVYHIHSTETDFDIIPEHKVANGKTEITIHNQLTNAGNYGLLAGNTPIAGVAFNYSRKESDLTCYTADELNVQLATNDLDNVNVIETGAQSLQQSLTELEQGKKLWKLCIILVLVFLATEVLLLRFMK